MENAVVNKIIAIRTVPFVLQLLPIFTMFCSSLSIRC